MTYSKDGFVVRSGDSRTGKRLKMKGDTLNNTQDIKISSKDTNGDFVLMELSGNTPLNGPPLHIHLNQNEFVFILEGEFIFQVGEDKYKMKPGDTIFLPRNIQHAFMQLNEVGKFLVSFSPAGKMEDFFIAGDSWTSPPTSEEIIKFFENHDLKIVGPPLNATIKP